MNLIVYLHWTHILRTHWRIVGTQINSIISKHCKNVIFPTKRMVMICDWYVLQIWPAYRNIKAIIKLISKYIHRFKIRRCHIHSGCGVARKLLQHDQIFPGLFSISPISHTILLFFLTNNNNNKKKNRV